MRHHKLFSEHPKTVRDLLNEAIGMADEIHLQESLLIQKLILIDNKRFYVRYGFKSLSGFCRNGLKFSKTQTQRIVTRVRRDEPTSNIRPEEHSSLHGNEET